VTPAAALTAAAAAATVAQEVSIVKRAKVMIMIMVDGYATNPVRRQTRNSTKRSTWDNP